MTPATQPYTGRCRCGAVVWSSPSREGQPRYQETVICRACGRDCSRRDFPGYYWWRLRHDLRLARKRQRVACWQLRRQVILGWEQLWH